MKGLDLSSHVRFLFNVENLDKTNLPPPLRGGTQTQRVHHMFGVIIAKYLVNLLQIHL